MCQDTIQYVPSNDFDIAKENAKHRMEEDGNAKVDHVLQITQKDVAHEYKRNCSNLPW